MHKYVIKCGKSRVPYHFYIQKKKTPGLPIYPSATLTAEMLSLSFLPRVWKGDDTVRCAAAVDLMRSHLSLCRLCRGVLHA